MSAMGEPPRRTSYSDVRARDAEIDALARIEILRRDGAREPGENLERAAALIKASFELRDAFAHSHR